MSYLSVKLLLSVLSPLLLVAFSDLDRPAFANDPSGKSIAVAKRTLHFPKGKSLGMIHVGNITGAFGGWANNVTVAGAVGDVTVSVPRGQRVVFEANHRVFENPACLEQISPAGIDGLKLGLISLADREDDMCDAALAHIGHFQGLTELNVDRSEATDKGVANLSKVPSLVVISCFLSSINGQCFKELSTLPALRVLLSSYCQIKPENLKYLAQFPKLEKLNLDYTHLDAAGVKHLGNCKFLKNLSVRGNVRINDSCMVYLQSIKSLQALDLRGTSVSIAGLRLLKGMNIKFLCLPSSMKENLGEIKRTFPKIIIALDTDGQVDSHNKMLYAPLH